VHLDDPTMSGLNEYDYPSLSDDRNGLGSLQEINQVKRIPLPAELVERFACIFLLLSFIAR
jgi:nuclear pore complex protein Nup155